MIKGILFDMGETLVHNVNMDFKKGILYLYNKSLSCNTNKDEFISEAYLILKDIFNSRTNLEFKMIDYIYLLSELFSLKYLDKIEIIEEGFAFAISSVEYVCDAEKILKYFKNKKYKLILMSNTSFSKRVVIKMLGRLVYYFDDIIVSSETVFRKPDRRFFEIGIRKLSLDKSDVYYIGNDYYYDIYGSNNCGVNSIWFNEKCLPKIDKYNVKKYKEIKKYTQLINEDF